MSRVSRGETLCSKAIDFEDILASIVRSCIELHTEPRYLIFALEEILGRYCNNWLWGPFGQSAHYVRRLFVRVNRTGVRIVIVFYRRIGVESGLCKSIILVIVISHPAERNILC